MATCKTNFGAINGRRIVTFKVSTDGRVVPAKLKDYTAGMVVDFFGSKELITAHESFCRWKIARKAWMTRKGNAAQMTLPNLFSQTS